MRKIVLVVLSLVWLTGLKAQVQDVSVTSAFIQPAPLTYPGGSGMDTVEFNFGAFNGITLMPGEVVTVEACLNKLAYNIPDSNNVGAGVHGSGAALFDTFYYSTPNCIVGEINTDLPALSGGFLRFPVLVTDPSSIMDFPMVQNHIAVSLTPHSLDPLNDDNDSTFASTYTRLPMLTIDKTVSMEPVSTGNPNEFQVSYLVVVQSTDNGLIQYDLTDTLMFGDGASINTVTASYVAGDGNSAMINGAFDGQTDHTIVMGETLDPMRADSFSVDVVFTVDPNSVTMMSADCDLTQGETGSGLLNTATVAIDTFTSMDSACTNIPMPGVSIDKSITMGPNPTGNANEFTIDYQIVITNTGDAKAFYDLTDTLMYGDGAMPTTVSASYVDGDGNSGTNNAGFDGQTDYLITSGEMIDTMMTDTFAVTVVFTVDPTVVTMMSADCELDQTETGTGLLNKATVGNTVPMMTDSVCTSIPMPGVSIDKSITMGPNPTGNANEFTIDYQIVITNTGDAKAFYDLTDTLMYGDGAMPTMVSASYVDGDGNSGTNNAGFDGLTDFLITSGEMLDTMMTDTFVVSVVFTVDPDSVTEASSNCVLNEGETATGLLNKVEAGNTVPTVRDSVCTDIPLIEASITKVVNMGPNPTGNANEFTIEYYVIVENSGNGLAYYDLSDTLMYGDGAMPTMVSATYVGGDGNSGSNNLSFDGQSDFVITTNESVDTMMADTFAVVVIFTVDPTTVTMMSADCDLDQNETGTGLLNSAEIGNTVPTMSDSTCTSIPMPGVSIDKSISMGPNPTGNANEFTIDYQIVITNTGDAKAFYDLTDTLMYGDGAMPTMVSAAYVDGDGNSGTNNAGFDGQTDYLITSGEMIDTMATDTFVVTVVFTVDPTVVTTMSADCELDQTETGTGLLNKATVGNTVTMMSDSTCTSIPMPGVSIDKSISMGPNPTGNANEFTIDYQIVITNTGDAKAFYDLTDTLMYGDGAMPTMVSASYVDGDGNSGTNNAGFDGQTDYLITSGEMVDTMATDTFVVTVVFTVDPTVVTDTSGDCTLTSTETGTGLLNKATVGGDVPMMTDSVCTNTPMPNVSIDKSISMGPNPTGNANEFTIDYQIVITNTGDAKAFYDLTDTLMYGDGAMPTMVSASYVDGDGNSGTNNAGFDGQTDYLITSGEMIDTMATDTFVVTVVFTVDPTVVTTMSADCELDQTETGTGLLNKATVGNTVTMMSDSTCTSIPMPGVSIDKSITMGPNPTGNANEFTIDYQIVITNTGDAKAFYDLTDTLMYGDGAMPTMVSASYVDGDGNSGTNNAGFDGQTDYLITSGEMVDTMATDTFVVTVVFTVDPTVVTDTSGDCTLTSTETGTGLLNKATVRGDVPMMTDSVCTNTPMPNVSIDKSISMGPNPTGNANEFTIDYQIVITNTGDSKAFYDLTDTLMYGDGAMPTMVSASYVDGDGNSGTNNAGFDGQTDYLITSGEMIDTMATDTFVVTVVFSVDPTVVTTMSADCELDQTETGTGLLNKATVGNTVTMMSDSTCTSIPMPGVSIDKSISMGPNPTGNANEFTIDYQIVITNTGDSKAFYDLTDTLMYGDGAMPTMVSASYVDGDGNSGTNNAGFDGQTDYLITSGEMIDTMATDTFVVTVVFTVDPTVVTDTSGDCTLTSTETGTGLLNKATVGGDVPMMTDSVCTNTPMPNVSIDKSISMGPNPTGNANEFTIDYQIVITNTGDAKAFYDLTDTLMYGDGAMPTMVSASYVDGDGNSGTNNAGFDGQTDYLITSGEMIDTMATDTFVVTVVFTVDPTVVTTMSADCELDQTETGTGLLNKATVGNTVTMMSDSTCTSIPMPGVSIDKSISMGPNPTGNANEFTIDYQIVITNTGDAKAFYDLTDTLMYGDGAMPTMVSASYVDGDGNSGTNNAGFDGQTDYLITSGEMVDTMATDTFVVTVVFTVDPTVVTDTSGDCTLTSTETGTGLLNKATVGGGVPMMTDSVCTNTPMPNVSIDKSISMGPNPTGNANEFTIDYQIVITNTGDAKAFYDLTDTLMYGDGAMPTMVSASYVDGDGNSGMNNAGFDGQTDYLITSGEMIDTMATDTFVVTVVFTVDPTVVTDTSGDCTLTSTESGTGLLNKATVGGDVPTMSDSTCTNIPMIGVSIEKSISMGPDPTGNANEFTIDYQIVITNTGDAKAFYDLTDTLMYGNGAMPTMVSAAYVDGDGNSGTNNAGFNGQTDYLITSGEMVDTMATDTFVVTVVFTVDPTVVTDTSGDCTLTSTESGTGLLNKATVGGDVPTMSDSTCTNTPMPSVSIDKSVSMGPDETGNINEFSIEYQIIVTNDGDAKAFYDLTDTLMYGAGAMPTMVSAAYVDGDGNSGTNNANFDGQTDFVITTGEMLEVGASDTFAVTVIFSVDPNTLTMSSADCELTQGESGTGLLNTAVAGNTVMMVSDTACNEIPNIIEPCVIDCPDDITITADPAECVAVLTVPVPSFTGDCMVPFSNDYNGGSTIVDETFPIGVTVITWTAVGLDGNTVTCTVTVTVLEPAPEIICPPDQEITLDPGDCEEYVHFEIDINTCFPNDSGLVQLTGLPSGSPFPIGTTVNTFVYTDSIGQSDTCSFQIVINEFPDPILDLACNDFINLSLDGDCKATILPDMILEGGPYGCSDCYLVVVTYMNGDTVPTSPMVTGDQVGDTLVVSVEDTCRQTVYCWGNILIEDKIIPDLLCTNLEVSCTDNVIPGLGEDNLSGAIYANVDTSMVEQFQAVACPGGNYSYLRVIDMSTTGIFSDFEVDKFRMGVETSTGGVSATLKFYTFSDTANYTAGQVSFTYADLVQIGSTNTGMIPALALDYWDMPVSGVTIPAGTKWLIWELEVPGGNFVDFVMGSNTAGESSPSYIASDFCGVPDPSTLASIGFNGNWISILYGTYNNIIPFPLPDTAVVTPPSGEGPFVVSGFDPCGDVTLTYEDEEIDIDCTNGSGYTQVIIRRWYAEDESGNSTSCNDTIRVKAATIDDLVLPVDRDGVDAPTLECNGDWDNGCDGIPNTGDAGEGDGIPQPCEIGDEISSLCDIWANYQDVEFPICGYNTKKIFREWYILDKCTGEFVEYTQVIIVNDTEAPVINCPDEITVGVDPYNCGGTWQVTAPDAYDNCSGVASWSVSAAAGTVVDFGGVYTIQGLPEGCTEITYTVYDGCGNDAVCTTQVCVVDDVPPVPVCDFNTIVSLGVDGRAKIYAETFDDGSYDNCCLDYVEVRRTQLNGCWNTFYGPHVEFCCDDIGTVVEVELRAVDCSGNTNSCWVNVTVEDKLNPTIVCPPDITVSCDYKFDLNDLGTTFGKVVIPADGEVRGDIYIDDKDYQEDCQGSIYAGPVLVGQDGYAADNCDVTVSEIANANLSCGTGVITRIFTATDAGGRTSSCIQRITIVDCDPFYIADTDSPCRDRGGVYTTTDDVTWPCDVTLDGCSGAGTDPDMTGRPIYEDDKCSLVADTFVDEVFTIVDDACFKILRHWSIIDWCQEDPSTGLPYRWDYSQVIKVIDEEGPIVTPADPGCDLNATECAGYTNLAPIVEDCTPADHIVYWWRIDADNDGVGTLPGGFDFEGNTADPSGVYPYGTHRILWVIEDMCGNKTTAEYTFEVADCKKPSPVCINGLSSVVMPSSGAISIWGSDFDASSFDNCDDDLEFRIWYDYMDSTSYPDQSIDWSLPTASSTGQDVLDYLPTGAVFYCGAIGDMDSRTFTVRIYVVDDAGNWDYCTTTVTIDDNDDVCTGDMSIVIAGDHQTEYGEWIEGVQTTLLGGVNGMTERTYDGSTDPNDDGGFLFYVSAEGYDWEVTAEKNDHFLNGVTAQDLSLIQRHVAGIEYLNSNYKLVAADANADTEINIVDVLELRKLLLGINSELSSTTSWKHIDADYTFPGVTNTNLPADVYSHEMIRFENLTTNELETDFIGVKIGDVDGDAVCNSFIAGEERSGNTTTFTTADASFGPGDEVKVNFTADNFNDITAYQFTIGFDQSILSYVGAEAGSLDISDANFGTHFVDRGLVTTVWYDATAQSRGENDVLFTVVFKATEAGNLHNVISLGSSITPAIAFSNETGRNDIELQFLTRNGAVIEDAFALYQNAPNPFIEATTIKYVLPEAADVTLTVYDMSGRVLKTATAAGNRGVNMFELKKSELSAAGVLYYKVETEEYTALKRMILAD